MTSDIRFLAGRTNLLSTVDFLEKTCISIVIFNAYVLENDLEINDENEKVHQI